MKLDHEINAPEFDGSEGYMPISYFENRLTTPADFVSVHFDTTTQYADPGEFSGGLNLIINDNIIGYLFWTDYDDESRRYLFQKADGVVGQYGMQYTVHEISDNDLRVAITDYDLPQ